VNGAHLNSKQIWDILNSRPENASVMPTVYAHFDRYKDESEVPDPYVSPGKKWK
jgi:hypothetical protein